MKIFKFAVAAATLLATHGVFAQSFSRDYSQIEFLIDEASQYGTNQPAMTPSERAHVQRMRSYLEVESLNQLRALTFVPMEDSNATLDELERLSDLASHHLNSTVRSQLERTMLDTYSKDIRAEAAQRSQRQIESLLEHLADQESREWGQSLRRVALGTGANTAGDVLLKRVESGLCTRATADLEFESRNYDMLTRDVRVAPLARSAYSKVVLAISSELSARVPSAPTPIPTGRVCVTQLNLRDRSTMRLLEPTLGLFLADRVRKDLEVDPFGIPNVDQIIPQIDSSASFYLRVSSSGRSSVRLEVIRTPATDMTVWVRLTAVDYNRNSLAEVVVPVTLLGELSRNNRPLDPVPSGAALVGRTSASKIIEIKNGSRVELIKGQSLKVDGDIRDQYGFSMGMSPVSLRIDSDFNRVDVLATQDGGSQILAKNVSDSSQPTRLSFEVNMFTIDHPGMPTLPNLNALRGSFTVTVSFASFSGFSYPESVALAERLYQGILQRPSDPGGLAGYARTIQKEGLKGLRNSAKSIAESQEFRSGVGAQQQPMQIVEAMYLGLMGRGVDPGAVPGAVSSISQGRAGDFAAGLVSSVEFRNNIIGR